jgi:tetratricopeptide (TPR) repeat protein
MVRAGVQTTPQKLVDMIYLPARKGALQPELLGATRRYGLVPYQIKPDLETILREVAHGNPVLVLQNMRLKVLPQWHYAVAVGYDLSKQEIVLRSGDYERYTQSFSRFERTWADGGYWGLTVLPPTMLPVTAEEQRYLTAVSALERVSPGAAEQAYRTALNRWTQSLGAQMGLGNIAYARKDLPTAEAQYKNALEQHPDAADAWNNLAQILFEQGKKAEAVAAAEKAVGLGGPHIDLYRKTLMEISSGTTSPSH